VFSIFTRKAAGAFRAPAFPVPSIFRGNDQAQLGQIMPREQERVAQVVSRPILRDACERAPQDEVDAGGKVQPSW
jgi:hypothetical protein